MRVLISKNQSSNVKDQLYGHVIAALLFLNIF